MASCAGPGGPQPASGREGYPPLPGAGTAASSGQTQVLSPARFTQRNCTGYARASRAVRLSSASRARHIAGSKGCGRG